MCRILYNINFIKHFCFIITLYNMSHIMSCRVGRGARRTTLLEALGATHTHYYYYYSARRTYIFVVKYIFYRSITCPFLQALM